MSERRVAILGEARVDQIRDSGGVREQVTGDAVDLACALQGLGLAVTVIAPVGDDADGARVRAVLDDAGVQLVALAAPAGTARRTLVHDRRGRVSERSVVAAWTDTRRSNAAQAAAEVIVDLRDRRISTLAEQRDDVLRAFGQDPGEVRRAGAAVRRDPDGSDASSGGRDDADARNGGLLPAPVVAGTFRHGPVRLLPESRPRPGPAADAYGLNAEIDRIAT